MPPWSQPQGPVPLMRHSLVLQSPELERAIRQPLFQRLKPGHQVCRHYPRMHHDAFNADCIQTAFFLMQRQGIPDHSQLRPGVSFHIPGFIPIMQCTIIGQNINITGDVNHPAIIAFGNIGQQTPNQ